MHSAVLCVEIQCMTTKHTTHHPNSDEDVQLDTSEMPEVQEDASSETPDEVTALREKLSEAELKYQRALADYHNLVRRTQQENIRRAKLATKDFVTELLQPLTHLSLAADQLKDPGLGMVIGQLWETLKVQGLEQIECLGEQFDAERMEVVEIQDKGAVVTKILMPGYILNGEVLQCAKVVLD